jgi:transmembrane sensor
MGRDNINERSGQEKRGRQVENLTGFLAVPETISKEAAWEKLAGRIETGINQEKLSKPFISNIYIPLAVAASLALIAVISIFLYRYAGESVIEVGRGETATIILPDNTEVWINSDSKVSYKSREWEKKRSVRVEGEAFFSVTQGSGFTVEFEIGFIEVYGTSFNLFARKNNFEVICKTGKVIVEISDMKLREDLFGGEGILISIKDEGSTYERFETGKIKKTGWIDGEFHYNNATLTDVFDEIERQFDVTISVPDAYLGRRYTGFFSRDNIREALDMVCIPMNISYRIINGKKIIIE